MITPNCHLNSFSYQNDINANGIPAEPCCELEVCSLAFAEPVLWQPLQPGACHDPIYRRGVDMRHETAGHLQLLM